MMSWWKESYWNIVWAVAIWGGLHFHLYAEAGAYFALVVFYYLYRLSLKNRSSFQNCTIYIEPEKEEVTLRIEGRE